MFLACLFFADDLCLIAPTRGSMQKLLHVCEEFCTEFCLSFNAKKLKSLLFGKQSNVDILPLTLNSENIENVSEWKYLGVTIVCGKKLSFSVRSDLRSFYCASNSILSVLRKPDEIVQMNLLYSNCIPIISYASEVKTFSYTDMLSCNVAINNAIRRIFSYNRWESVRTLRSQMNFPSIYEIFHRRRSTFEVKCRQSGNSIIRILAEMFI